MLRLGWPTAPSLPVHRLSRLRGHRPRSGRISRHLASGYRSDGHRESRKLNFAPTRRFAGLCNVEDRVEIGYMIAAESGMGSGGNPMRTRSGCFPIILVVGTLVGLKSSS